MGPEGGKAGGEVLFQDLPYDLMKCERSKTGKYLAKLLNIELLKSIKMGNEICLMKIVPDSLVWGNRN